MGQGQRPHGSKSKVMKVKVSIKVEGQDHHVKNILSHTILAGGLMSTSSCIFLCSR